MMSHYSRIPSKWEQGKQLYINRIPFCTECDHVKRSELGFMLEPFANRFGFFWPE